METMSHSNRSSTETMLDKALLLLRLKMSERHVTQKQVQEHLGWGRTYISQLFCKQKELRFHHILDMLRVIGVSPGDFFRELFPPNMEQHAPQPPIRNPIAEDAPLDKLVVGVTEQLIVKGYLSKEEVLSAARSLKNGCDDER